MTTRSPLATLTLAALASVALTTAALADRDGQSGGMHQGRGAMQVLDFTALDTDADGKIIQAELDAGRAARVAGIDTNADGLISAGELAAHHTARAAARSAKMVLRNDLTETLSVLRADPFDTAEMRVVMLRQSQRTAERLDLGQDLLLGRIAEMSPAERAAFADRLEAGLTRDGRDRDGAERRP